MCTSATAGCAKRPVGNAFAAWVPVRSDAVEWTRGNPSMFRSSSVAERGFCRDCGTPLTFTYTDGDRAWMAVALGSLDRAGQFAPGKQYGVEARLPWTVGLHLLPGRSTEEDMIPDRAQRLVGHQHPDHATPKDWTAPQPDRSD